MRKVALVFILAVVAPSLLLAGLALRSLRDQGLAAERQDTLLAEAAATEHARQVEAALDDALRSFSRATDGLLALAPNAEVPADFDESIRKRWPAADVGFAVSVGGSCIVPHLFGRPEARQFRLENERFLCNAESVEVVWNSPKGKINLTELDSAQRQKSPAVFASGSDSSRPARTFRDIVGTTTPSGSIARFVQDELQLLFWHRHPSDPSILYGARVSLHALLPALTNAVRPGPALAHAALLRDDSGSPVAVFPATFKPAQARPIAAADIGEKLPHWRVEVFALDPARRTEAVRTARLTIALLVTLLVLAIGTGSWLIAADLGRQLRLARQKTDFVSNVSHELKTPLTSIRMFAELLDDGAAADPDKRRRFTAVIRNEAGRLSRLLDNVLDFSRLEQNRRSLHLADIDLAAILRNTAEACRPQLESAGVTLQLHLPNQPVPIQADADALAQVLYNLLSNVEKYAASGRAAHLTLQAQPNSRIITVTDLGPGIPAGSEERIFEQFYRAHDSLSSGIPGSGLGLALVRRLVTLHGGSVQAANAPDGGAVFTVTLPHHSTPA